MRSIFFNPDRDGFNPYLRSRYKLRQKQRGMGVRSFFRKIFRKKQRHKKKVPKVTIKRKRRLIRRGDNIYYK